MQNIKKYFMTLALLLTAVTGAWAQDPNAVTAAEINSDLYSGWSSIDEKLLKASDLPGFQTVTEDQAKSWTGVPSTGRVKLFYEFVADGNVKVVIFNNGVYDSSYEEEELTCYLIYEDIKYNGDTKYFYTTGPAPTEWDLTSQDGKTWTLAEMPASNIELQVEYYAESNLFLSKEALADAANISVLNGETAVAFDDDGKSAKTITEGTAMTVTYNGTKKLLGMKVEKKAEESLIVNPVVGQIIGSDGKNYDANATLPDGVKAVAMIAYVGNDAETSTTYNHGLALALENVSGAKVWCSQTSVTCLGTQYVNLTKFNDLAGIANTDALVNNTGHIHDAASAARGYNSGIHPDGTSAWFLPSAGQWYKMVTAAGDYATLKTNAGLQSSSYWSSTESGADKAWRFSFSNGGWNNASKVSALYVRACLAF